MSAGRPTVPCGICGAQTPMTGTKRCDWCWEIEGRIRRNPERAQQILDALQEQAKKAAPRRFTGEPPTGFGPLDEETKA